MIASSGMYALFLVPEGKGNVLQAMRVADTSNAILTPAVCARACHVVSEVCREISETQLPNLRCLRLQASPSWLLMFVSSDQQH
jgi:hypothetical protein